MLLWPSQLSLRTSDYLLPTPLHIVAAWDLTPGRTGLGFPQRDLARPGQAATQGKTY